MVKSLISGNMEENKILDYFVMPTGWSSVDTADKILKILTKHDITSRNYILKLCPDRVHTIIPGMMVVKEIMDRLNCKELWVSRYGVREGYLCKNFLMTGSTQEVTK